jgi:hypothetical protein
MRHVDAALTRFTSEPEPQTGEVKNLRALILVILLEPKEGEDELDYGQENLTWLHRVFRFEDFFFMVRIMPAGSTKPRIDATCQDRQ